MSLFKKITTTHNYATKEEIFEMAKERGKELKKWWESGGKQCLLDQAYIRQTQTQIRVTVHKSVRRDDRITGDISYFAGTILEGI